VIPFGGDQPFIGVWQITDYCATNCSFVSGEGSSAMWLLTLAVLLPLAWRAGATRILLGLAIVLSLNRIAFGGHFLSDVLLAWWMTLAVMAALYRFLYIDPPPALANDALEDGLTQVGQTIRGAVSAAVASLKGKG
jgi:membrane-associated phospholipid phosphatase